MQLIKLCIISLIGLASAAPSVNKRATRGSSTTVKIVNSCDKTIQLGQLGTGITGNLPTPIAKGKSKTYTFNGSWSGRFWARENCIGTGCALAGAAVPASLAEFTFLAANDGHDYYDLSFVDGYNLPLSITPQSVIDKTAGSGKYWCGAPACKVAPACPVELQLKQNGVFVGCKSACSAFGNPEYCCSGAFNTPDKCPINKYAAAVKKACPDAYSYAYDDKDSLYQCVANAYTVTWCPKK